MTQANYNNKNKKKQKKYYAVRNGRKVGVFDTWDETEKQVVGYPGAMYKSFKIKKEALDYIGVTVQKPTTIITAGARLAGGGSGWAYTVTKDNNTVDMAGDSEEYKEEAEMESVALYQALRGNQYLADENVALVINNYRVLQYLKGKSDYLPVPDNYVKDEIDELLKVFKHLFIIYEPDYKNHKAVSKVENMADRYAQEAVVF